MFKTIITASSLPSYINLDDIAKETKFVIIISKKLSSKDILDSLMKCVIKGIVSFRNDCLNLLSTTAKVDRQAKCLAQNKRKLRYFFKPSRSRTDHFSGKAYRNKRSKFEIKCILTGDSSFQRVNSKNATNFPDHGNKK